MQRFVLFYLVWLCSVLRSKVYTHTRIFRWRTVSYKFVIALCASSQFMRCELWRIMIRWFLPDKREKSWASCMSLFPPEKRGLGVIFHGEGALTRFLKGTHLAKLRRVVYNLRVLQSLACREVKRQKITLGNRHLYTYLCTKTRPVF